MGQDGKDVVTTAQIKLSNVSFENGKIVIKGDSSHEHESFLVVERILANLLVRRCPRHAAKLLPGSVRIEISAEWIEVLLRRTLCRRVVGVRHHSSDLLVQVQFVGALTPGSSRRPGHARRSGDSDGP